MLKPQARAYREQVQWIAIREKKRQGWVCPDRGIWLYMDLYLFFPDQRYRDSHNFKLLIDSFQDKDGKLLYVDDYFVMPRVQSVNVERSNPRLEVFLFRRDLFTKEGVNVGGACL